MEVQQTNNLSITNRPAGTLPTSSFPTIKLLRETIDNGGIITNVGQPEQYDIGNVLPVFKMINNKERDIPDHQYGKLDMHNVFSAWDEGVNYVVPAVNEVITIQPRINNFQLAMVNMFTNFRAGALYFVKLTMPIGAAVQLEVYAPELDETTTTRGVIWKSNTVTGILFYLPYSSDVNVTEINKPRLGQSGLSLKIKTILNNSSNTVGALTMTIYSMIVDIKATRFIPVKYSEVPAGFKFAPQPKPTPPTQFKGLEYLTKNIKKREIDENDGIEHVKFEMDDGDATIQAVEKLLHHLNHK